jgi:methionyl-tRNA formyltransferase
LVRAVTRPYPGAFYDHGGSRIRIWRAAIAPRTNEPVGFDQDGLKIAFPDGVLQLLDWDIEERSA